MLKCVLFVAALGISFEPFATAADAEKLRVVGYLPEYRLADVDPQAARSLTDLIFFSVLPEPGGAFRSPSLENSKTAAALQAFRRQAVKIHLCVGGWDRSQKFPEIFASAESRTRFAEGTLAFCRAHEFAGIDLDWEHPANDQEQQDYGRLLEELVRTFHADKREVALAMAGWQQLPEAALAAVDGIHLMSYDAPDRHATFEQAVKEVDALRRRNVPAGKIRIGVPFYGRGIQAREHVLTYAEIVQKYRLPNDRDEVDGLYFNGPHTIRRKAAWAKEQKLGGVMIWEIGQDARDDRSLLRVIHKAVR